MASHLGWCSGAFILWLSATGGDGDAPATLDGLLSELKKLYPDRDSVQAHSRQIARRLEDFAGDRRPPPEGEPGGTDARAERAPEADRARLLAAEVLFLGGASSEGRQLLDQVAKNGASEDGRARALYLLGEQLFFLEKYLPEPASEGSAKPSAYQHWQALNEKYPDSAWSRRAAVPLRYLRFLKGEPVPAFRETFHALGQSDVDRSSDALRGKVLVLDFWKGSTPGQQDFEIQLATDMKSNFERYPDLRGQVEILGVNLDLRTVDFARAVNDWRVPWPQHHDTLGFDTPLARLLGIPRAPHLVVMDPAGHLAYMGADRQAFFRSLTQELRRLRGVDGK